MITPEGERVRCGNESINEASKCSLVFMDGAAELDMLTSRMQGKMCNAGTDKKKSENGGRCDKGKEIAVIPSTDTVVQPYTVMILCFDTVIADTTVMGSRWSPDVASFAIFRWHFHSCRL